jgi:uncharacterized protein (DUF488 family)
MPFPFYTIGHSTRSIAEFIDLLRAGKVEVVVDVRTVPRSRANPQYGEAALSAALSGYQIGYCRLPALGGLRKRAPAVPDWVNGWWKNRSFHNYADHALSDEFRSALEDLIELGRSRPLAFMCSEAVWWRCHRRIIADHLIARGETVLHLMGSDKAEPAQLSEGAQALGAHVTYPLRDP